MELFLGLQADHLRLDLLCSFYWKNRIVEHRNNESDFDYTVKNRMWQTFIPVFQRDLYFAQLEKMLNLVLFTIT
jgi:hypothetical protein